MAESEATAGAFVLTTSAADHAPGTARLFIGAVLRHLGHTADTVDDTRLIVSELVTVALLSSRESVEIAVDASRSVVEVSPIDTGALEAATLAATVITSLLPGLDLASRERRIRVPLPAVATKRQ
jgi:anti-sigma regulatory factor (Ser/Thr protein kinase)